MRKPIHITTPWPTQEEMERHFPISKGRQKALRELVNEFMATRFSREQAPVNSMEAGKRRKSASAA